MDAPVSKFAPDLWTPLPLLAEPLSPNDKTIKAEVAQLRRLFQKGLTDWLKGAPSHRGIALVNAVIRKLLRLIGNTEARRLWWVALGLSDGLQRGEIALSARVKQVLYALDAEISVITQEGVSALERRPPESLLKTLLFLCASVPPSSELMHQISAVFALSHQSAEAVAPSTQATFASKLADIKGTLKRLSTPVDTFVPPHQIIDDKRLPPAFFTQAGEALDACEESLLRWFEGQVVIEIGKEVQSQLATLKQGGGGEMALVSDLAQALERFISKIQQGTLPPDSRHVEFIERCLDRLRLMLLQGQHHQAMTSPENLIKRLNTLAISAVKTEENRP